MCMTFRARTLLSGALFSAAFFPCMALASSTLSIKPASGAYHVDDVIPVKVVSQSPDPLAAVDATISYDPKLASIDVKDSSADVSWVVTPTADNIAGTLKYSGMVKKGAAQNLDLLSLLVHALRPGKLELHFADGASTIAADGSGGNTLGRLTDASFDVTPTGVVATAPGTASGTDTISGGEVLGASDTAMVISSPNITDENNWYSLKDALFSWTLPPGVTNVRIGLTKKHDDLGYKSISGTTTRLITGIDEGEWFFHVTPDGSDLAHSVHFRVAIDRTAPTFATTTEVLRTDKTDPNIAVMVSATDTASGIAYFEFGIDGGAVARWQDDGTGIYHFKSPSAGGHDLMIAALDRAGNRTEQHLHFTVTPLEKPTVTMASDKVPEASEIVASIKGLPNATAQVEFEGGVVHHNDTVQLDGEGKGTYKLDESVLPGTYLISVTQTLGSGATSKDPVHFEFTVTPSIIGYLGRNPALSIALIPVVLGLVIFGLWKLWKRRGDGAIEEDGEWTQLALPAPKHMPQRGQRSSSVRPVQTAPLEIRRVVRVNPGPGGVIDLRR